MHGKWWKILYWCWFCFTLILGEMLELRDHVNHICQLVWRHILRRALCRNFMKLWSNSKPLPASGRRAVVRVQACAPGGRRVRLRSYSLTSLGSIGSFGTRLNHSPTLVLLILTFVHPSSPPSSLWRRSMLLSKQRWLCVVRPRTLEGNLDPSLTVSEGIYFLVGV